MFSAIKLGRQLPLSGLSITHPKLIVRPNDDIACAMLQISDTASAGAVTHLCEAVAGNLKVTLPSVGKWVSNSKQAITILCTKPNCWMILSDTVAAEEIHEKLHALTAGAPAAVTLMWDQFTCLDICGEAAPALLAKGCSLDFADNVFLANQVASTLLARTNVTIWRNSPEYRCLLDVSYSDFLWAWLSEATLEFSQ